jgi:enamine deaminase RidA (YjgF/YER057c/UK114 family)
MTIEPEVEAQTHQTFRNIAAALAEVGASLDDVVRVRYYLTHAEDFQKVAPIFGQYLGKARPAATALICALVDPAMRIEIEVTAKKH